MTTNQTIDGVPRELRHLLERVATEANHMLGFTYAANYEDCRSAVDELRALLDAPACNTCCDQGEIFVSKGKVESHMLTEPDPIYRECPDCKPAAQPQGEPVRNQCDGCQAGIPVVNGAHRMGKPGGYPDTMSRTAKLYAEQPAPVAPESINHGACVDLRVLLNKYIEHVGQCEGVDFISEIGGGYSKVPFDAAEIAELEFLQVYPLKSKDPVAPSPLNYGALDPVERLAVCRGEVAPVAVPNDSETNIPFIGLTPKGSRKVRYGKAVWCPNCGDSKTTMLVHDDNGILIGPCPHCLPKPPPSGSDRISMEGAMIICGSRPNPITHTGNGAVVNLDGYVLYAPGAEPVSIVMPERMVPRDSYDSEADQWNACLDELKRLNGREL